MLCAQWNGTLMQMVSMPFRSFVIVDGAIEMDNRAQNSLSRSAHPTRVIQLQLNRSRRISFGTWIRLSCLLCSALLNGLLRWRKIRASLASPPTSGLVAGFLISADWLRSAIEESAIVADLIVKEQPELIHAHDLFAAVTSVLSRSGTGARLVYDSHEFQVHRHRRSGWLRICLEYGLERMVLRRVDEVRVVNKAIANRLSALYTMPPVVKVEYNDYYQHHAVVGSPPATESPAVVYVGKGVDGRQLERLDLPVAALGFEVHVYLLGAKLPSHIAASSWNHGPTSYEEHLLALVRSRRCLMWCCLDASSTSYQLATPNKFFQAMAVGMPVLASQGTYLAEVVERYGLGLVLAPEQDLREVTQIVMGPLFTTWVAAISSFRTGLRDGTLVI